MPGVVCKLPGPAKLSIPLLGTLRGLSRIDGRRATGDGRRGYHGRGAATDGVEHDTRSATYAMLKRVTPNTDAQRAATDGGVRDTT